jgi:hypothetical protein
MATPGIAPLRLSMLRGKVVQYLTSHRGSYEHYKFTACRGEHTDLDIGIENSWMSLESKHYFCRSIVRSAPVCNCNLPRVLPLGLKHYPILVQVDHKAEPRPLIVVC